MSFKNTGSYLRERRLKRNLTQQDLAKILGVNKQYISNYERGVSAPPMKRWEVLFKTLKIAPVKFKKLYATDKLNF